ncbi:MAG: hypothetical protein ACLTYN_14570 [Dysosmobacter welbionis]
MNLGHTVGHAIEKCSGYVIPHGHAVARGWPSSPGLRRPWAGRRVPGGANHRLPF